MTYENIDFNKDFFVTKDGYFYYIEETQGVLYEKVCDGDRAFTYPIIESLGSNSIKYMQHDGYYFWTLQNGATSADIVIKKWYIDNYTFRLSDTINFSHTASYDYNVDTFIIENYDTSLSSSVNSGDSSISISNYYNKVESGEKLLIGPNNEGQYETVTVTGTLGNPSDLGLIFFTQNSYDEGTNVSFSKNIWFINRYSDDELDASLLKYSLLNGDMTNAKQDSDFEDVVASCYYLKSSKPYMLFVVGTNLRFLNLDNMVVEKTMTLDNLEADQSTVIPIKSLQIENDTLYRLQGKATYYGTEYDFSTYNYQPSPLRSFIDSVSIDAYPKILPSNGMNVSKVEVVANDQYAQEFTFKPVHVTDDDSIGFITIADVYTNLNGVATTYYKAGTTPREVTIVGVVTQYN